MIDRMRYLSPILAKSFVGLDVRTRSDLALQPGGEGGLGCDFAGGAKTGDYGCRVVAFGIGEVAEVEGGFYGWGGGG